MRFRLKFHWPAFVLAVAVGFILVFPALSAKWRFGFDFSHPANISIDDELFYLARLAEVMDGYPTIGNPYLWEHKTKPPSPVFLGEYLLALPIKLFRAHIVAGSVFYDFLLPFLAVLASYSSLFLVTRQRWLSLFSTAFLFLGMFLTDFGRAVSPQFNFLFWLTLFILVWAIIHEVGDKKIRLLLAGIASVNLALVVHLSAYYWTFYLAFFAILSVLFLSSRYFSEARWAFFIFCGGLLLSFPYFWLLRRAFYLPEYAETLRRLGMITSRSPSGLAIVLAGLALLSVFAILLRMKIIGWDRSTIFLTAGAVAAIVSTNQHLITGKNLEFSSHYYMLSAFWFVFCGAYLLQKLRERFHAWRDFFICGAFIIVALTSLWGLSEVAPWFSGKTIDDHGRSRYLPVLEWIAENVDKDDVVYASDELSGLIPIYTAANVYFAPQARFLFLSDQEVRDRFILANYHQKFDRDFIRSNARSIWGVYYIDQAAHNAQINKLRGILGLAPLAVDPIPEKAIDQVLARHNELRRSDFGVELRRYRIDYVVLDSRERSWLEFEALPFLEAVRNIDPFRIYRFRNAS